MTLTIKKDYLPEGHRNRPGHAMKPKGLLFHTTNNWDDGAGDELHGEYMENTTRVVSWHDTVDKDSCTLHIPHNENAWHAGDGGTGYYNRNWIGMEIACEAVDRGDKLDKATYNNAVERAAQICNENDFGWDQLQPHNIVYGKNCPHTSLFDRNDFKEDVFKRVAQLNKKSEVPTAPKPVDSGGDNATYMVEKGDTLSEIALKHKTTVKQLTELNNIKDPGLIYPGQKIILPGYLHVVKAGQTLSGVAEMHGLSVDYIARLNNIEDPDFISVGQRLKLTGKAPAAPNKKPAKPVTDRVNGITVRGQIEIVGVKNAAYICDRPSSTNSKNLATIGLGKKIKIAGSVPGWWEVIYNGRRAYVNEKYGRLLRG